MGRSARWSSRTVSRTSTAAAPLGRRSSAAKARASAPHGASSIHRTTGRVRASARSRRAAATWRCASGQPSGDGPTESARPDASRASSPTARSAVSIRRSVAVRSRPVVRRRRATAGPSPCAGAAAGPCRTRTTVAPPTSCARSRQPVARAGSCRSLSPPGSPLAPVRFARPRPAPPTAPPARWLARRAARSAARTARARAAPPRARAEAAPEAPAAPARTGRPGRPGRPAPIRTAPRRSVLRLRLLGSGRPMLGATWRSALASSTPRVGTAVAHGLVPDSSSCAAPARCPAVRAPRAAATCAGPSCSSAQAASAARSKRSTGSGASRQSAHARNPAGSGVVGRSSGTTNGAARQSFGKGGRPVTSSQATQPSANRSVHGPKSRHWPRSCSGAMYAGVP